MSDVLARAAEVLGAHVQVLHDPNVAALCSCGIGGEVRALSQIGPWFVRHQAQMLADEGLLAESARPQRPTTHETLDGGGRRIRYEEGERGASPVPARQYSSTAPKTPPPGRAGSSTAHSAHDTDARVTAQRAATEAWQHEAERLRELLDEALAKIERMEEL